MFLGLECCWVTCTAVWRKPALPCLFSGWEVELLDSYGIDHFLQVYLLVELPEFPSWDVFQSPIFLSPVWLTDVSVWQKSNQCLGLNWDHRRHIHLHTAVNAIERVTLAVCFIFCFLESNDSGQKGRRQGGLTPRCQMWQLAECVCIASWGGCVLRAVC